jgi:hypothetical protein
MEKRKEPLKEKRVKGDPGIYPRAPFSLCAIRFKCFLVALFGVPVKQYQQSW